jgi:hypothetical protein
MVLNISAPINQKIDEGERLIWRETGKKQIFGNDERCAAKSDRIISTLFNKARMEI